MKDAMVRDFQHEMTEFLSLLNLYLKLGFEERAEAMLDILPSDKGVLGHAGRVLLANEYNEKAYEILTAAGGGDNEIDISRAKALIEMKRYEEAE